MALAVGPERRVSPKVLQLIIPAQVLQPHIKTERVLSHHSLSYPFIERNMGPNKIAEIRPGGKRWVLIAAHGGYTPTEHVMAMRWDGDYTPDPVRVADQEGRELMPVMADVARWIADRSYNELVVFGLHSSAASINQEGIQSVPTMFHPYVFGLPAITEGVSHGEYVNWKTLKHKERKSVRGGRSNFYFGQHLAEHALNGSFRGDKEVLQQLFTLDEAEVGFTGVRIPTKKSLEETLRTPGFFEGVLKPIARILNQAADDLSRAFIDFDPDYVRARIEAAVLSRKEPEDPDIQEILADITKVPDLWEKDKRKRNIEALRELGYSDGLVAYLHEASDKYLPAYGPATRWKRGFGYTFAICQGKSTGEGFMAINTTVESGPAGVVEGILGGKLVRPPKPFSEEELESKRSAYHELVASLNGHVVHD